MQLTENDNYQPKICSNGAYHVLVTRTLPNTGHKLHAFRNTSVQCRMRTSNLLARVDN